MSHSLAAPHIPPTPHTMPQLVECMFSWVCKGVCTSCAWARANLCHAGGMAFPPQTLPGTFPPATLPPTGERLRGIGSHGHGAGLLKRLKHGFFHQNTGTAIYKTMFRCVMQGSLWSLDKVHLAPRDLLKLTSWIALLHIFFMHFTPNTSNGD